MKDYIKGLEDQNEELQNKLAEAELKVRKFCRKKPLLPLFYVFKYKNNKKWYLMNEFVTVCTDAKEIEKTIKYNSERDYIGLLRLPNIELVGFQYWKQTVNYRWALSGLSNYYDINFKKIPNIKVDDVTGEVFYF